jgi:hypothetical protein
MPPMRSPGLIKVAIHANWDIEAAIRYLTPGGSGRWESVHFAPAAAMPDPDFVLILNTPAAPALELYLPPERVWFGIGEPPDFKAYHRGQGEGTVVLTCDEALAASPGAERRYILAPPILRSWHVLRGFDELARDQPARIGPIDKPKLLSWVTSDKERLRGHRLRMRFLRAIRGRLAFDLFGRGFDPIADKWDGIAPYRYSIAFENSAAPHYFSEKLMDCFLCRTLPIYYGSPEIARYFPARSILALDPADPLAPERIREIVASDLWRERQDALAEARRLVLHEHNMFARLARLMRAEAEKPVSPARPIRIERIEG